MDVFAVEIANKEQGRAAEFLRTSQISDLRKARETAQIKVQPITVLIAIRTNYEDSQRGFKLHTNGDILTMS